MVARTLAPAHIVAVAAPTFLADKARPVHPTGLSALDGVALRSLQTGRVRRWMMRDAAGQEALATLSETIVVNDPAAMREAALLGLGVAMLAMPDVLPALEAGYLVRLLPGWYADAGAISIYYASRALLPRKTRVFIDWIANAFEEQRLPARSAGSLG